MNDLKSWKVTPSQEVEGTSVGLSLHRFISPPQYFPIITAKLWWIVRYRSVSSIYKQLWGNAAPGSLDHGKECLSLFPGIQRQMSAWPQVMGVPVQRTDSGFVLTLSVLSPRAWLFDMLGRAWGSHRLRQIKYIDHVLDDNQLINFTVNQIVWPPDPK